MHLTTEGSVGRCMKPHFFFFTKHISPLHAVQAQRSTSRSPVPPSPTSGSSLAPQDERPVCSHPTPSYSLGKGETTMGSMLPATFFTNPALA